MNINESLKRIAKQSGWHDKDVHGFEWAGRVTVGWPGIAGRLWTGSSRCNHG